jgi:hypothetical protein
VALLINIRDQPAMRMSPHSRGFIFEEMWIKHEGYDDMVAEAWENICDGVSGLDGL